MPDIGMQVEEALNFSPGQEQFYQHRGQLACISSDSQIALYEAANANWDDNAMEVEESNR
jgi:hypothetical protein